MLPDLLVLVVLLFAAVVSLLVVAKMSSSSSATTAVAVFAGRPAALRKEELKEEFKEVNYVLCKN